jgi:hypothetical protein
LCHFCLYLREYWLKRYDHIQIQVAHKRLGGDSVDDSVLLADLMATFVLQTNEQQKFREIAIQEAMEAISDGRVVRDADRPM